MLGKIPFRDWPTSVKLGLAALIRAGREIRRFSARRLVRTDSGSILSVYVAGFSFLYLSSVYFHSSALLLASKFRARTSCFFLRPDTTFHRSQGVRRFIITSYHNDDTTLPFKYPRDLWIDIRIDVFGVRQLYIYMYISSV